VLKIQLNQALIRAPFDGAISKRLVDLGEWVNQGQAIATLVNPNQTYALFDIPLSYISQLNGNDDLSLSIQGKNFAAAIEGLIKAGDSKTRTIPLKVRIKQSALKADNDILIAGAEAVIELVKNNYPDSVLAPRDAVIKRFGQDVVFTIDNGVAKMIPVNAVIHREQNIVITGEGIAAGMPVIVKGNERVFPGQAVSLKSTENKPKED